MRISAKDWAMYTARLSRLGKTAENMMREYIAEHGEEEIERLWDVAFGLVTKYGEGAASLACEMYDALAEAQGAKVPPASPAYTARLWETEVAMKGTTDAEKPAAVSRLVKRSAADTTLKNAIRDHAEFAWIPSGDSCAFCLTLASRGWQPASKNSLKNGHAEHIHANCDCQYAIRFDQNSTVQGYDPEKYRKIYDSAEGSTPQEKINSMRREIYAEQKEKTISSPIERNTSRGKPTAILHYEIELNNRQQKLLDQLTEFNKRVNLSKEEVSMVDLSALTAKTGDEFAMFTNGSRRLVVRGNSEIVPITKAEAKKLNAMGYTWSGHTHVGSDALSLFASSGDLTILRCFKQERSVIYNSVGEFAQFWK